MLNLLQWAQLCLLKARQMRRKSVKKQEEFEKLSEKLSRAIYQIEGYEGFDVVTFWSTHRTVAEAQYGIEVGIQVCSRSFFHGILVSSLLIYLIG